MPADDNDLETIFGGIDYEKVKYVDSIFVDQTAQGQYGIFLFKNQNINSTDQFTPAWTGQSDLAPSSSTVYLQVYNRTSGLWETLASNNTSAANVSFTLTGTISSNLNNYYDVNKWVSCRVYQ